MIRQLLSKWAILSTDIVQAMEADSAVINSDGTKEYVETVEVEVPQTPKLETPENVASAATSPKVETPEDPAAALFGN